MSLRFLEKIMVYKLCKICRVFLEKVVLSRWCFVLW